MKHLEFLSSCFRFWAKNLAEDVLGKFPSVQNKHFIDPGLQKADARPPKLQLPASAYSTEYLLPSPTHCQNRSLVSLPYTAQWTSELTATRTQLYGFQGGGKDLIMVKNSEETGETDSSASIPFRFARVICLYKFICHFHTCLNIWILLINSFLFSLP